MEEKMNIHANAISIMGYGILLLGPTASGKSDLTLRLLHINSPLLSEPCALISDDQTVLLRRGDKLIASPPEKLAGKMEVRGVGILQFEHKNNTEVALALDLSPQISPERIPDLEEQYTDFLGIQVPTIQLASFEVSAPEKAISIVQALKSGKLRNHI